MIVANIHNAKTNLSKLIERAEAGEEVIIARDGKPVVRLAPVAPQVVVARRPDGFPAWMGSMRDEIWVAPDFDDYDADIARTFEDSEIFPEGDQDA